MTTATSPSLWRNGAFLRLWSAETVSQVGSQVSAVALPLVAIVVLGASAFEVALLGTVEMLPFILFSLPAGAWIDRLRRRPILIAGDLGRAALLGSIPVAALLGILGMPQLYVVGFVVGTLTVLFDIAYQAYVPSIVAPDRLLDANGKLEVSRTLAQTAGPAIGGSLVGLVAAPLAIAADACSFVASGLLVLAIRDREPAPATSRPSTPGGARPSLRREIADGLRFVGREPSLRAIAACTSVTNLFGQIAFATFMVFAVRELGLDALTIGVVMGLGSLGGVAGAASASRLGERFGVGRTILGAAMLSGIATLLAAVATPGTAVPLLVASGVVAGFSAVVYNVNQVSYRQAITPGPMRGRMNATMRFLVWGTIPIGALIGGAIATGAGVRAALWVGVVGTSVAWLPLWRSPVRAIRRMPDGAGADA